jgi:hypothetical protein
MTTFTNKVKNIVSVANKRISAFLGFIVTEDESKVLLGENEDQRLLWNRPTRVTNLTKN